MISSTQSLLLLSESFFSDLNLLNKVSILIRPNINRRNQWISECVIVQFQIMKFPASHPMRSILDLEKPRNNGPDEYSYKFGILWFKYSAPFIAILRLFHREHSIQYISRHTGKPPLKQHPECISSTCF